MKKTNKKFNWKNVLKLLLVYLALVLIVVSFIFAVNFNERRIREKNIQKLEETLVVSRNKLYEKQNQGIYGGKTPAETIFLYYEFLESRDFRILSTYFIPQKRSGELDRFGNASKEYILSFVQKLKAAEIIANKADLENSFYIMSYPLDLKLNKMPNGVWEFEYLNDR